GEGGAARSRIRAPLDGGPAPFTRIDEHQPRAVETLQGSWAGTGGGSDAVTFASTMLFPLPDEASLPVSSRRGATRREFSPPAESDATVDVFDGETLVLSGSSDVAGHYGKLLGRTTHISGTDATA